MLDIPTYAGPADPAAITRDDLFEALRFLIAVEPDPEDDEIDDYEDYLVRMAPWENDIAQANQTVRLYAAQRKPQSLEAMQADYYAILQDERLGEDEMAASVAGAAVTDAWDGIGHWRK